jgi:signal peptidase I
MSILFFFIGFLICSLLFHALLLWAGAKVAKIPQVSYRRALGTFCVMSLSQFLAVFLVFPRQVTREISVWAVVAIWLAEVAVLFLVAWLIIRGMFRTTYLKAFFAWLMTLAGPVIMLPLVFLIIKPLMAEAFVATNNSMAPTLLGPHFIGNCPNCGKDCVFDASRPAAAWDETPGICPHCFKTVRGEKTNIDPQLGDRFMCNKVVTPRRWDMVVFRSIQDPTQIYVKRLIGLPGEQIVLKEGAIWVNGVQIAPPEEVAPLYSHADFATGPGTWGSPEEPAQLGADKYFVLGDFIAQSADSRAWHQGLPKGNIQAVVALTYWPPSRWRIFR